MPELAFLKLGGSLITDKGRAATPRPETIRMLAEQAAAAIQEKPSTRWLLGHGSGSFGHVPARRYGTRQGVSGFEGWHGFAEVWRQAAALNRIVVAALHAAGLPAMAFPPSSSARARNGQVEKWEISPLLAALEAGLLPVVYGDVAFDSQRGGTILSTEELFAYLATRLRPARILIAGIETGVWEDFPRRERILERITPETFEELSAALGGSEATDVTGGMAAKVAEMLELASQVPGLQVRIFDGRPPGSLKGAMLGEPLGTLITAGGA